MIKKFLGEILKIPSKQKQSLLCGMTVLFVFAFCAFALVSAQARTYTVQRGDTLYTIAQRYGVSVANLQAANGLVGYELESGQRLRIPSASESSSNAPKSSSDGLIEVYYVHSGDTLYSILQYYGISREILNYFNPSIKNQSGLAPKTPLRLPKRSGYFTTVPAGQDLLNFAMSHNMSLSDLVTLNSIANPAAVPAGQKLFVFGVPSTSQQTTSQSISTATASLSQTSATSSPQKTAQQSSRDQLNQQHLSVLENAATYLSSVSSVRAASGSRQGRAVGGSSTYFTWPVTQSGRITSSFGPRQLALTRNRFHTGIDIALPTGSYVVASKAGRVVKAGWVGTYGNAIYIDHGDNTQTRYAHLSRIAVPVGAQVAQGQPIGLVGNTGLSTGPHLHFEIRFGGRAVNPAHYLK